jgi:hypothetical protein
LGLGKILKKLQGEPVLEEFAKWLCNNEYYDAESVETLLCKPWDGAYPEELLGDDILVDIESFIYNMALFAVEKTYGKKYWNSQHDIRIVPEPSYEDCSYIYALELKTKTVLAHVESKTWYYNSDALEEDLEALVKQLEESKGLLAVRLTVDS